MSMQPREAGGEGRTEGGGVSGEEKQGGRSIADHGLGR